MSRINTLDHRTCIHHTLSIFSKKWHVPAISTNNMVQRLQYFTDNSFCKVLNYLLPVKNN